MGVDPQIIAAWTAGWAISRGKPPPTPIHNGFYLEDGRPQQKARYVFPDLREEVVRAMTATIDEPWVYLKFCAPQAAVAAVLPDGWRLDEPGFLMAADSAALAKGSSLPSGYSVSIAAQGDAVELSIRSDSGETAARGRLVLRGALAIFDQIVTEEAHRRRGLGTAVMHRLGREAVRRRAERGILVATPAGRALYLSLGWKTLSDYSSAFIPG
jgi:GNAT superfamily N-acetyltransferase